jgi:hypothetical protein
MYFTKTAGFIQVFRLPLVVTLDQQGMAFTGPLGKDTFSSSKLISLEIQ